MNSGEFARLAGVTQRALRHWRKLGLLSDVGVSENGYFDYTVRDLVKVLRIKNLSALGFSLAQVKEMLAENGDDAQAIAVAQRLADQRYIHFNHTLNSRHIDYHLRKRIIAYA